MKLSDKQIQAIPILASGKIGRAVASFFVPNKYDKPEATVQFLDELYFSFRPNRPMRDVS